MNLRLLSLTFLFAAAFGVSAQAGSVAPQPVLLTIDDSNPSDTIITATGAAAYAFDNSTTEEQGIDLLTFLTSPIESDPTLPPSTLIPSGGTLPYNSWDLDDYSESEVDFHIYRDPDGGSDTQTFSTTTPAFTGSWEIDVSGIASLLPTDGTTGAILVGFSGESGEVIGQWVVVPEPSQYGVFIVLGVAGLMVARSRMSTRCTAVIA